MVLDVMDTRRDLGANQAPGAIMQDRGMVNAR
jgi:hypothetical protein